jgi:hypothetical protein
MDFLLLDGNHSGAEIGRDWRGWSRHVVSGGAMVLRGSRSGPGRTGLDGFPYTREVTLVDPGFRLMDAVSLTVLECVGEGSPR